MDKKLFRSSSNKMVSGVLGGVAEYFNFDATILRLIFAIAVPFTAVFPLVFIYIAAAFIMPVEREL